MTFNPYRIFINNSPVLPPEYTYTQLQQSGNEYMVATLQRWLGTTPVTAVWNNDTAVALDNFRSERSLTAFPDTVTIAVWDALEEHWTASGVRSREKQYYAPVLETPQPPNALQESLSTLGIVINDHEIPDGVQLYQALSRRIHRFEGAKNEQTFYLYPALRTPGIHVSPDTWRRFSQTWASLSGAPWWGYVCMPQPSSVHWAAQELHTLLLQLGKEYFQRLAAATSIEEALQHPLRIKYTGYPLGGRIAQRDDFSQIGLHAALEIPDPDQTTQQIAIAEALTEVHPAWRIRFADFPGAPASWPWYPVEGYSLDAVLEMDPDFEKLVYNPGRLPEILNRNPELLNRFTIDILARALANRMEEITAVEIAAFFEGLRDTIPGQTLAFVAALGQAQGLGTMLEIIHEAGDDILNAFLGLDFDGLPVGDLPDKIRTWQQVVVDLIYIWRLVTNFSEAFSAEVLLSKVRYYSNNNPLS